MSFLEKVTLINKITERMKKHDTNSINYQLMEKAIALILKNLEEQEGVTNE